jgi:hypothetical protein
MTQRIISAAADGFNNVTLGGRFGEVPALTRDDIWNVGDTIGIVGTRNVKVPSRRQTYRVAVIAKKPRCCGIHLAWWYLRSWWFVKRHRGIAPPYAVYGS